MQVTARGWARDMGARVLLTAGLACESVIEESPELLEQGQTYFRVDRHVHEGSRGRRKVNYTALVYAHANLILNGSYLVQLELDRNEIARLFYLTNGDRALPELLETFSAFKTVEIRGLPKEQVETAITEEASEEVKATVLPDLAFNPAILKKVEELELSVRSDHALRNADIVYVGDLVQKTEAELLRTPFFGRKSMAEIKEVLMRQFGLHLGMEIPGWPPENIEELAKRFGVA